MKIYKITCICTFIILLSGCNAFSTKTEATKVSSEVVKSEPVVQDITQKEQDTELKGTETSFPIVKVNHILLMKVMFRLKYPYQILVQKAFYTKFEM